MINDALKETVLFYLFCFCPSFSDFPVMNTNCFCNKKIHIFSILFIKQYSFFWCFPLLFLCHLLLHNLESGSRWLGRHVDRGEGRESHHMGVMTHSFHSLWSTEDQNTEEWQGPRKTSCSQDLNPRKLRIIVHAEDD